MKNEIMLDLETLGTTPGSLILSIGAAKFGDGKILDTFYASIDPQSGIDAGLTMDVPTVMWWLQQSDAARAAITKGGEDICSILFKFAAWAGEDAIVWGNGASFDNVLLSVAYDKTKLKRPWKHSGERCYRTVKNLYPEVLIEPYGIHHNALDDAIAQALHLMRMLAK